MYQLTEPAPPLKHSDLRKIDHAGSARTGKIRPDTSGFIRRATAEKQENRAAGSAMMA